jgi:predicted GIY-YIG superfamily endonuclease
MKRYIYALYNDYNDEVYVGCTIYPDRRFYQHKLDFKYLDKGYAFKSASYMFLKYGEHVKFKILEELDSDKKTMHEIEMQYIVKLNCINKMNPKHLPDSYYSRNRRKMIDRQLEYNRVHAQEIALKRKSIYHSRYSAPLTV